MDGLRALVRENHNDSFCKGVAQRYYATKIVGPSVQESLLGPGQLETFFSSSTTTTVSNNALQTPEEPAANRPDVRLLRIFRHNDQLIISQHLFTMLLRLMEADEWVVDLIRKRYRGLHYSTDRNTKTTTLFAGADAYWMLWTMPTSGSGGTETVRVIVFLNEEPIPKVNAAVNKLAEDLAALLASFAGHVPSPYLPAVAMASLDIKRREHRLQDIAMHIARIEKQSGYSPLSSLLPHDIDNLKAEGRDGGGELQIDQVIQWSRDLGQQLLQITLSLRTAAVAEAALEYVEKAAEEFTNFAPVAAKLDEFMDFVAVLKRQLNSTVDELKQFQERAKTQESVNFALLTHQDAIASITLAEASIKLAEAAKQDSSSMKTIAVVTMVFLPGTFFAALFAMPSLQWSEPNVIQSKFWIYWAFAIPATLLVFATWHLITNRRRILAKMSAFKRRWRRDKSGLV